MTEYADKWLEEISSDFIVRTCQLLPKSCTIVSDRMHIPVNSLCCLPKYSIYCGSSQEFYIRPVNPCIDDFDALVYSSGILAFVEDIPVLPNDFSRLGDTIECYRIEPYLSYPGFVRLRVLGTVHYNWRYKKYDFSHTNVLPGFIKLDTIDRVTCSWLIDILCLGVLSSTVRGPAIRFQEVGSVTLDNVRSVWCPQWPREAEAWLTRRRDFGWPTIAAISEVVKQGCHVVHAQHRSCRSDVAQWRYSFSVAEVILIQSWTKVQQIVYHLLRFLAKKELIQKNCPKQNEVFCTYHLKTLMLWTCEKMSPQWWNSSSVIATCCELLQKLSKWLKRRYCPNYFIPEANLFQEQWTKKMYEKSERQLDKLCNSGILCRWFVDNYILPFTRNIFTVEVISKVIPHFTDYLVTLYEFRKARKLESLDLLFSNGFTNFNKLARSIVRSEPRIEPRSCLSYACSARKMVLLKHCEMSVRPIPEDVWCLEHFDTALYSLNIAFDLMCGQMSCDSELFAECVKGLSLTPKAVRCQYHIFPKPLAADRSRFQFLRAHDFMENLTGLNSPSEFRLLSALSKEFLKKALECDDSQSNGIAPPALVNLAALHFASSKYQIVIDLCSAVLIDQTIQTENETMDAECLLFIDDVARVVGFCLVCKKFNEVTYFSTRQIFLDLRLTPTAFAYYLTVVSAERISKHLKLNYNLTTSAFPLERCLLVIANRKLCTLIKAGVCLREVRLCVYRRTESLKTNLTLTLNDLMGTEKCIEALMEIALENMTSFYNVIREDFGIQCSIINCYRALYLYKCRQYDKVLQLCERILHEPGLQSDLKKFAFANVLLLPPLDSFFDGDVQSLLGLHTLFYYLSPLNDDMNNFIVRIVHSGWEQLSESLMRPYSIKCHYFLGRHFLARYLKLKCCIDCNQPFAEIMTEFVAMKNYLPFEHIICRFIVRKLHHLQINFRVLSKH